MTAVMTRETIESAIREAKATSLGAIWRALGHETKVSGKFGKKVRELVPNWESLGQEATKDVMPEQPKAQIVEAPAPVEAPAEVENPYRASSKLLGPLFAEASKDFFNKKEFIAKMAKALGRTEKSVKNSLDHIIYKSQNKGQTDHIKKDGSKKIIKVVLL